jgi:hypothetical protein
MQTDITPAENRPNQPLRRSLQAVHAAHARIARRSACIVRRMLSHWAALSFADEERACDAASTEHGERRGERLPEAHPASGDPHASPLEEHASSRS